MKQETGVLDSERKMLEAAEMVANFLCGSSI